MTVTGQTPTDRLEATPTERLATPNRTGNIMPE